MDVWAERRQRLYRDIRILNIDDKNEEPKPIKKHKTPVLPTTRVAINFTLKQFETGQPLHYCHDTIQIISVAATATDVHLSEVCT